MKITTKLAPIALLLASTFIHAGDYAVVVNANNPIGGEEKYLKRQIKLLFLKQKFRWDNRLRSIPMSASFQSDVFVSFRDSVLKMSESDLKQHWVRLKLKSGDSPPREVQSERIAVRLVERDEGAFTIVSKATAEKLGDKVKVLFEF